MGGKNVQAVKRELHLPVVAIVGRPNVGKSSLFNAIIGRRLSIVHEMPGVTRDRVVAPVTCGNTRFQLIDTGGLGMLNGESRKVDQWDNRIASQVDVALEDADVLVMVGNVQDGVVPLDEEVAKRIRISGKPVLFVANKCDNPTLETHTVDFLKLGFRKVFPISCLHKNGVQALLEAILPLLPVTRDSAVLPGDEEAAKPMSIAVVGRPNVGKSSLINALLGEERVMVSDVAGTTRDAIDVNITLRSKNGDREAIMVDTAGMRKQAKVDSVVEYFSMMRTKAAVERAELTLLVVEASPDGVTAQDRRIAAMVRQAGKGCVIVANKFDVWKEAHRLKDLEEELRYSLTGLSYCPVVFISAKNKTNLDGLLDQMIEVMDQMELKISTGVLNRVLADAMESHTPPVIGPAPFKMYYASVVSTAPLKVLMFVNNPKYCADNYLTFLKNTLRETFDLTGLPIEIELRARPKKVESIRRNAILSEKRHPVRTKNHWDKSTKPRPVRRKKKDKDTK